MDDQQKEQTQIHFLKSFANAARASVGAPEEVCRSTTVRTANNSHVFRAFLFTMRAVTGLLHSKRALGSKYAHWRQVCSSALQVGHELSAPIAAVIFAPQEVHFTDSPNAIIFGERGPSRSAGFDCGFGFGRCGSRSLSM
jgi:hypothetical protein